MAALRKPAEVRREREIVRAALSRFLALLAPVTAMQVFTGANGRPLDAAHPGLPPYARRALDRFRQKGILVLAGKFWRVSPEPGMAEKLKAILADDKELDKFHLADKYLKKPGTPISAEEADEIAEALESFSHEEVTEILAEPEPPVVVPVLPVPVPASKRKKAPPPPESEPEVPDPEEGEELPFPFYVAKRFDMLSDELEDLKDSLPSDTKAHLEGIGMHMEQLAGDVKALTDMFLNTAAHVESSAALVRQLLEQQKEVHDFIMTLKSTLTPKVPEEKKDPNVKRTA